MTPVIARRTCLVASAALLLSALLAQTAQADLVSVIAAAKPSVLPVGTFNATDSPRFGFRGTGFVVGDGSFVVTNFHVLPPAGETEGGPVIVVLVVPVTPAGKPGDATGPSGQTGQLRRARVVGTDRSHDLALLKIEGTPLTPLQLDEPGAAREGQSITLMGFPIGGTLGFAAVSHRGIIASITAAALPAATARQLDPRALVRLREGNYEVLQLDATAYPGNSGGPVLDADSGRVVGIVNMVLVKAGRESALSNPTGISYAIPVRHLHDLLKAPR